MNGIRRPAVILADSMEEYMAPPNPYKNPPKSKLNLLLKKILKEGFKLFSIN